MLTTGKLGFWGLTALVFGLMVGVGIYNLPQNMSAAASPGAVFLAWMITGAGILPLVLAFKYLSENYPQYNAGLYQYAQAGFGNFAGFNIAWGYWLCSAFSNVTYGVMLNDSFGAFFPVLHSHGLPTVIFCSVLIWVMYSIVSRGVKTAKTINSLLALIKVGMLVFIIVIFTLFFKADLFRSDIWGALDRGEGVVEQIRNTMMVTLFCFFGVEGAMMMSARAKSPKDVGRAGIAGFVISLVLYLAVSLLCFGLMGRARLAGLQDPSVAYILRDVCGEWAYWFVICAVIISLLGGWVAWTLVVAQVPYEASIVGILPKAFSRTNSHGMPAFGLMASSIAMELFLLLVVMADDVYLAALHITGLMIIPCYFFTSIFMVKVANNLRIKIIGWVATLFCLWMAYAGGLRGLIMTSVFYLAGIGFYISVRRERGMDFRQMFTRGERWALIGLIVCSAYSVWQLAEEFQ
ncbi:MAG: amino acid permease [Duncaniella sp.]|nr:amino acid permease [Duncaniella sp.]